MIELIQICKSLLGRKWQVSDIRLGEEPKPESRIRIILSDKDIFSHQFKTEKNIEQEAGKLIPFNPEEIYSGHKNGLYIAVPKNKLEKYINNPKIKIISLIYKNMIIKI